MELLVRSLLTLHLLSIPTTGQTPNKILSNGTIQWGQLGYDRPYKTVDFKVDDGGMGPWYSFSRSFISSALAEYFPTSIFAGFVNGTIEGKHLVLKVMETSPGYIVCLVFGFLYTTIFFCLHICCCICFCSTPSQRDSQVRKFASKQDFVTQTDYLTGRRKKVPSNLSRTVIGVIFFVLTAIALSCTALVFESSRQINQSVKGLNQSISDGFNDVDTFFENIKTKFTRIGEENFNFLSGALQRYISDVAGHDSKRLTERISDSVGLSTPLNKLSNYSEEAATLTSELNDAAKDLRTSRDSVVKDLTARCAATCSSQISSLKGLPLTELVDKTEDLKRKFATNIFTAMAKTLDSRIKAEADKATKGVDPLSKLGDMFKKKVDPILELLRTFHRKINNETSKMQKRVNDFIMEGEKVHTIRFALTLIPALIVVWVTVLAFSGLFFGLLCNYLQGNTTNTLVAIGSLSLTTVTNLIVIIGAPVMLVSTILFMFGSLMERYGCQTFLDYKKMEMYAAASTFDINLTNYTFTVVGRQVSLNFFDVMEKCEKGETMYCALKMQDVVDVGLQELSNYKEDLKISNKMNFSNTAKAVLGELNVRKEIDDLRGTEASTDDLLSSTAVTTVLYQITLLCVSNIVVELISKRVAISSINSSLGGQSNADLLKPMQDKLIVMESLTIKLKRLSLKIDAEASGLPPLINEASTKLRDKAFVESVLQKATKEVVDTVLGFVDSYIKDVITKLEREVGKCTPVVSITRAILREALCRGVVDPLNGLWLSLGSCAVILVPILIISSILPAYFVENTQHASIGVGVNTRVENMIEIADVMQTRSTGMEEPEEPAVSASADSLASTKHVSILEKVKKKRRRISKVTSSGSAKSINSDSSFASFGTNVDPDTYFSPSKTRIDAGHNASPSKTRIEVGHNASPSKTSVGAGSNASSSKTSIDSGPIASPSKTSVDAEPEASSSNSNVDP